jgi:hypothetical protein
MTPTLSCFAMNQQILEFANDVEAVGMFLLHTNILIASTNEK